MAASNKSPWRYNLMGAEKPIRHRFNVAAGSTRAIKRGEICYADAVGGDMIPVAASTDNLHPRFIADEEQTAVMAARFMWFIVPSAFDVFEFDLDAATAIDVNQELQISDSQTLKASATDPVANAWDVPYEDQGVTSPTLTKVRCIFKHAGAGNVDLAVNTANVGEAA